MSYLKNLEYSQYFQQYLRYLWICQGFMWHVFLPEEQNAVGQGQEFEDCDGHGKRSTHPLTKRHLRAMAAWPWLWDGFQ